MIVSQDLFGLVFFGVMVAGTFAGMILTAHLAGWLVARPGSEAKREPFECGYPPQGPLPAKVSVSFYIAGLLLLVFDVEVVFLYPWAVEFANLGIFGFVEMLIFIGMLLAGYLYILRRGAFRW
jgi:NADH-quinone oxidoreductase subunit A